MNIRVMANDQDQWSYKPMHDMVDNKEQRGGSSSEEGPVLVSEDPTSFEATTLSILSVEWCRISVRGLAILLPHVEKLCSVHDVKVMTKRFRCQQWVFVTHGTSLWLVGALWCKSNTVTRIYLAKRWKLEVTLNLCVSLNNEDIGKPC